MSQQLFTIYISGDKGSIELRRQCALKRIPFTIRDIRNDRKALVHLQRFNLNTVPQVFDRDGGYVGDFDKVSAWLKTIAAPKARPMAG